jgi:arsenite-transporting ATPase
MARVILLSGKGGVGKTTVAAATALAAAQHGYRTVVLSLDLAHSLFDSFALDRGLFDQNGGVPVRVAPNLDVQEIDVQEEIQRHWSEVYRYVAMLMSSTGLNDVVAEEVAIIPGTEDVIGLMYINQYLKDDAYDVIVLDCPPTGDALRFVNMTSTLEWYMLRRFGIDRMLVKVARPLANRLSGYQLPEDSYFKALQGIFDRVSGADKVLTDPTTTTVRLVTNAERMVIRETQRAYMYFSMYGVTTDSVVLNRVMPRQADGYFAEWAEAQAAYAEEVKEYFAPVPVTTLPFYRHEVVGMERLKVVAEGLFGGDDPTRFNLTAPTYAYSKHDGGEYRLRFELPFADKREIDIHRGHEDLIIRVGSFKRHFPLPRSVAQLGVAGAEMTGNTLTVRFAEEVGG